MTQRALAPVADAAPLTIGRLSAGAPSAMTTRATGTFEVTLPKAP